VYLFHSTLRAKPGKADAYQERTISSTLGILDAPGFVRRILLRSKQDSDVFFYMSFWDTKEQLLAFRQSDFVAKWKEGRTLEDLAESVEQIECELVVDETASSRQA
jgi:heme-degrading monooxygenase HmoA